MVSVCRATPLTELRTVHVSGFGDMRVKKIREREAVLRERLESRQKWHGGPIEKLEFEEGPCVAHNVNGPFVVVTFKSSEGVSLLTNSENFTRLRVYEF